MAVLTPLIHRSGFPAISSLSRVVDVPSVTCSMAMPATLPVSQELAGQAKTPQMWCRASSCPPFIAYQQPRAR